jgi:hypothetical protein
MVKELNAGDEFIDQLLLEHHISLRNVYDFAEEHIRDLEQAESIFDLKNERDEKLCLTLFRLMTGEYAKAVSESFCNRYNIDGSSLDDIFFEQNKLFLIAAFIYNPAFFAMSWNLCGIIRSELAYGVKTQPGTIEQKNSPSPFQRTIHAYAASSADEARIPIWSENIDQDGIQGELRILANNIDNAGEVEFRFKFKEYHSEPPYYLRVNFKTNSDNTEHVAELNDIEVNDSENRELIIVSVQNGIPYVKGITTTGMQKYG